MIRDTSILTYKDILDTGILSAMEERVFRVIAANLDCCDRELAEIAELKINQLTGRRNGLMEEGCIEDAGTKEDPVTHRTVHIWRIPPIIDYKNQKKGRQLKLRRYMKSKVKR
jgi:hypothetical protein